MGQSISEQPPNHRPGEHYLPYDANAWRRLSQTYLNQLLASGQLTKEELESIELERYWHGRRQRFNRRSYSLSPVELQCQRRSRLVASSSVGNISKGFVEYGQRNQRSVWKNLEDSSHLTKNKLYSYYSLADLASIKPTRDQLLNLTSNLTSNSEHGKKYDDLKCVFSIPSQSRKQEKLAQFDSSFSSHSSNNVINLCSLSQGRFERNKSGVKKTLEPRNNQSNSFPKAIPEFLKSNQPEGMKYSTKPDKFESPRKPKRFQEYYQKSPDNNSKSMNPHQSHENQKKNFYKKEISSLKPGNIVNGQKHKTRNDKIHHYNDTLLSKSSISRDSLRSRDSSSPISSLTFSRTDSTRTTDKSQQSFIANVEKTERLVKHQRGTPSLDSSFYHRQQQSHVPEFRINSQERLNQQQQRQQPSSIKNSHYSNHVHFNDKDYYIQAEQPYDDSEDDDYFQKRHFQGSRRLMRINKKKNQNGMNDGYRLFHDSSYKTKYIPYRGYYLDPERINYSNYYQNFDRPRLGYLKILYIIVLLANISLVIWNSIYMHFASIKVQFGEPIDGRLYSMSQTMKHVLQGVVITVQILNCLCSMFTIYATIREKYWSIWITTVLFYLVASFGAYTEFLRGSISAWLLPLMCGHCGIIISHQIAIKCYSI